MELMGATLAYLVVQWYLLQHFNCPGTVAISRSAMELYEVYRNGPARSTETALLGSARSSIRCCARCRLRWVDDGG